MCPPSWRTQGGSSRSSPTCSPTRPSTVGRRATSWSRSTPGPDSAHVAGDQLGRRYPGGVAPVPVQARFRERARRRSAQRPRRRSRPLHHEGPRRGPRGQHLRREQPGGATTFRSRCRSRPIPREPSGRSAQISPSLPLSPASCSTGDPIPRGLAASSSIRHRRARQSVLPSPPRIEETFVLPLSVLHIPFCGAAILSQVSTAQIVRMIVQKELPEVRILAGYLRSARPDAGAVDGRSSEFLVLAGE